MHHPRNPKRGKTDFSNIDLRSRMYAAIPEMHAYLDNNPDKPFIQCEFIHAMGNGPGDIEDYYQLEEQYDTFVGGFVWEWCDHGIYMGTTNDGRKNSTTAVTPANIRMMVTSVWMDLFTLTADRAPV